MGHFHYVEDSESLCKLFSEVMNLFGASCESLQTC